MSTRRHPARLRTRRGAVLLAVGLVILAVPAVLAAPGDLDTFGIGGKVTTDFAGSTDEAAAVVRQPDGKLVAAGRAFETGDFDFALARYNADGTLDTSFGTGGKVTTAFTGGDDVAFALVVQPDGKLVAAGCTLCFGGASNFALARYNPNGTLDTTFALGAGKMTTDIGGLKDEVSALALQPDGKLVAAGTGGAGSGDFALVRYNANGLPDTTFGAGGKVTTAFGLATTDEAHAVILQPNGKLVAAGCTSPPSETAVTTCQTGPSDFALARYNPNGTLDTSFGTAGKTTTDFAGFSDEAFALGLQPDGKLVAAGRATVDDAFDFALARYNTNGTLDTTFGTGGKTTTDFGPLPGEAFALVLQPNARLVAAGRTAVGEFSDFALARYNTNGTLDTSFGTGGKTTTDFTGGNDRAFALVLQPNGRLVAAGRAAVGGSVDFALARYQSAGGPIIPVFPRPDPRINRRVSLSSAGGQGLGDSSQPSLSDAGNLVAFTSAAGNFDPRDTPPPPGQDEINGLDVFVRNVRTNTTEPISLAANGMGFGDRDSFAPSLSGNGRYVTFESGSSNLVSGVDNQHRNVFRRDRQTGTTTVVSVGQGGVAGNDASHVRESAKGPRPNTVISDSGRFVVFQSDATNLVNIIGGDQNGKTDVFVRDLVLGTTELVSVPSTPNVLLPRSNGRSVNPAISGNGRYVAFSSAADNLVPGDSNHSPDVFVHDRSTGQTSRVNVASDGSQATFPALACGPHIGCPAESISFSDDGRYVAFDSYATNLVPESDDFDDDIFVHDQDTKTTIRVNVGVNGQHGTSPDPGHEHFQSAMSGNGRFVAFESDAFDLVPGDQNDSIDVFVRDLTSKTTTRVSVAGAGRSEDCPARPACSGQPAMDAARGSVAYLSSATTIVAGDSNGSTDIFLFASQLPPLPGIPGISGPG